MTSTPWRTTPVTTITAGDWKLMEFMEDKKLELYNLKDDIGESKNVAAAHSDEVKRLQSLADKMKSDLGLDGIPEIATVEVGVDAAER